MDFFNNHKKLFSAALFLFLVLTMIACIIPALDNQRNNAVLPNAVEPTEDVIEGKALFVANGCVACHTQQVRNVEMDKVWGSRPGIAADYAGNHRTDIWRNTATLMGTERTGPDLTNIGQRQPSRDWHLTHLFNPRGVVKESIMPAYSWLFTIKDRADKDDVVVAVPEEFLDGRKGKVIATKEALQLVAYLQSLSQVKLPDGKPVMDFLYRKGPAKDDPNEKPEDKADKKGALLYINNCQSCHQSNGEGLKGAFPPLKGSKVVLNDDPKLMVDIIMNGYSGREAEGFGVMPAVGTNNKLSAEDIAAIMNHEKTSWGNTAKKVTPDQVKKLMEFVKKTAK